MAINKKTLTNANSILRLKAPGVYNDWVDIVQFQADNRTTAEGRGTSESKMGVDCVASFAYTPNLQPFNVYLEGNSDSIEVMQNIMRYQDTKREIVIVEFEQVYVSVGRRANFKGAMSTGEGLTSGGKVINGMQFNFNVEPVVENEV